MLIRNCNAKILRNTVYILVCTKHPNEVAMLPPKQNTNNVTEIYTNLEVFFIIEWIIH